MNNTNQIVVYGDPRKHVLEGNGTVIFSERSPTVGETTYGGSKREAELRGNNSDIPRVVNVRYAQAYGPGTDAWTEKIMDHPALFSFFGNGAFHPIYRDDIVAANIKAFSDGNLKARETMNVATGETTTWSDMVKYHLEEAENIVAKVKRDVFYGRILPFLGMVSRAGLRDVSV